MDNNPIHQCKRDFQNVNVLILGLGLLGRGVGDALFFHQLGSKIRITDLKSKQQLKSSLDKLKEVPAEYTLGKHLQSDIEWADVVVRNASVPWNHQVMQYARSLQKPVVMDTQLFVKYANIPIIGITGTRGKTTTTHLIYKILKENTQRQVILGGNIQNIATFPLLETVDVEKDPIAVLELSSWQLQAFRSQDMSPNISVVTNIYPDHLNSYQDMSEYIYDKQAITENQNSSDILLLNSNHKEVLNEWAKNTKAKVTWFDTSNISLSREINLKGEHNLENIAASIAVASLFNISATNALDSICDVEIPFRLEKIATISGRVIINDTTSTTPIATIKALNTYPQSILIAGGTDKSLPIDEMVDSINQNAKSLILLKGTGTDRIKDKIKHSLIKGEVDTLEEAISISLDIASNNDHILFSPGFTSFEMFVNEYDRGEQFNKIIKNYAQKVT